MAAEAAAAQLPEIGRLTRAGRAQALILQQFLMFGLLVPVLGSLSLAAQGIIGEKQARSLEPLLTTPLTVPELLLGKVLTPFVLSMCLLAATHLLHLACILAWGEPDVWRTLFWPRTLLLYLLLGPLIALASLLTAAIVSSRVNDARNAQQLGGFLALIGLAALIGIGGYFALKRGDIPYETLAAEYESAASRYVDLPGGVRMHYRDEGNPNGPTLLLIHGFSASLHTWEPWVQRLGDTYRIV